MTAVDFGEFTPEHMIEGARVLTPVPLASQRIDVHEYAESMVRTVPGPEPEIEIRVHWLMEPDSIWCARLRPLGEYTWVNHHEITVDTRVPIVRTMQTDLAHWLKLTKKYSLKNPLAPKPSAFN